MTEGSARGADAVVESGAPGRSGRAAREGGRGRVDRPRLGRLLGAATHWAFARPDMWPVALVAFLARGGIVVVALPFLVLPTPIGIASWIGADAITAEGPAARLVALVALAVALGGGALILGSIAAAAADRVVLVGWAADAAPGPPRARSASGVVARIVAVRAVAALPVVVATAWAIPRLADAVYRQLTLPDDLASPLVLRVVAMAPDAIAALAAGMLLGELVAGIATVHVAVGGDGAGRALARVVGDIVRRPVAVLGAYAAGVGLLLVGVGLPLAVGLATWELVRRSLAGGDTFATLAAVAAFVGVFVLALAADGGIATWRRASIAAAVGDASTARQTSEDGHRA